MTDLWLQSLPKLSPYAVSQLSLLTFLSGFFLAFAFKVPIVLVAPILTAVPVTRICPGVLRADVAVAKQALACLVAVLFALILTWATRLAISRSWASGGSGLDWGTVTDCGALAGRDCTGVLGSWAGAQNCAVLADTHGTCKAYCERHGRRCVRAMDDVGTGECRLQAGGHARQRQDDHGCLQDWRTQLCACTGPEGRGVPRPEPRQAPRPSERQAEPREAPRTAPELSAADFPWRAPCFLEGGFFEPLNMPGHGRTEARTALQCQLRCARTPACAHFSWWPDGGCHLQEYRASLRRTGPGRGTPVAGPGDCRDEEMLREARAADPPSDAVPPPSAADDPPVHSARAVDPPSRAPPTPARRAPPPTPPRLPPRLTAEQLVGGDSSPWLVLLIVVGFAIIVASGALDAATR